MSNDRRAIAMFVFILQLLACPHFLYADLFTFNDDQLLNANWNHTISGSGGYLSGTTTRIASGLVGYPASHLTQVTGLDSQFIGIQYRARHFANLATLSPSVGVIQTVNLDAWVSAQTGSVIFNTAIRQNGSIYVAQPYELSGVNNTRNYNRSIPISAFTLFEGAGPGQLDLSAAAAPLQFGYIDYNDSGIRNSSNAFVSTNLSQLSGYHLGVSFTVVPEPSASLLVVLGLGGLSAIRSTSRFLRRPERRTTAE